MSSGESFASRPVGRTTLAFQKPVTNGVLTASETTKSARLTLSSAFASMNCFLKPSGVSTRRRFTFLPRRR